MRTRLAAVAALGVALSATHVSAEPSAGHRVTVRVAPVSALSVIGGDITLTLEPSPLTGDLLPASERTRCSLTWSTNQEDQKVTVATSLDSPRFALTVEARDVTGGTAAGPITLDRTDRDFVVDITRGVGRCDLAYTASPSGYTGPESDVHVVTYTLTDQR